MSIGGRVRFVFLDTEVFLREGLNFRSKKLTALNRLISEGLISLVLPTVVLSEIRTRLQQSLSLTRDSYVKLLRGSPALRSTEDPLLPIDLSDQDWEAAEEALQENVERFLEQVKAIVVPVSNVDPEGVFEGYFMQSPPFDRDRKKCEFPDAFAAAALELWCSQNDRNLLVVSGDQDWRRICLEEKRFKYFDTLDALLAEFHGEVLATRIRECVASKQEWLREQIEHSLPCRYLDFNDWEGEVHGPVSTQLKIERCSVIDVTNSLAIAELACKIRLRARASIEDPDTGWPLGEDGELVGVRTVNGIVSRIIQTPLIVAVNCGPESHSPIEPVAAEAPGGVSFSASPVSFEPIEDNPRGYEGIPSR